VLAAYCLSSFLLAGAWNTLSPIFNVAEAKFKVESFAISLVALSLNLTYIPGSLLALFVCERHGLRATLLLGSSLQLVMCAFKAAAVDLAPSPHAGYALLLLGQLLGGLGQPLVLNTVCRLTQDWFPPDERDVATSVGFQASNAGAILFNALPAWLVHRPADLRALFLAQLLAWPLVIAALAIGMPTDRPAVAPSPATAAQWARHAAQRALLPPGTSPGAAAVASLAADLRLLARDADFLRLVAGFSCTAGVAWSLSTVEGPLIEACGYSPRVAGGAGAALLAGGVVACAVLAPWLRATASHREYLPLQRRLQALCGAATAVLLVNTRPLAAQQLLLAWAACGAAQGPLGPLTLEHAAQLTYPVPADSSSAALFMASNLASFAQTAAMQVLLARPVSALCLSVVTPSAALVMACLLLGYLAVASMSDRSGRLGDGHATSQSDTVRAACTTGEAPDAPLLTQAHQRAAHPTDECL
jgi:FLVCR family MFS transporter 7